ncbi:MAG TPA: flagellar basal body P-ring formation protein FlgA [Spirochaetia bacterium]|nr:flagellar basal body P-ring formation protein FlgA [Spirochaetia bacterium]
MTKPAVLAVAAFALTLCCLGSPAADGHSSNTLEVYLKKSCIVAGSGLTLADIVQSASGNYGLPEAESIAFPYRDDRLQHLPASLVRKTIRDAYRGQLILVGQGVTVIPAALVPPDDCWFYARLVDFLASRPYPADARLEAEVDVFPAVPQNEAGFYGFQLRSHTTRNGLLVGKSVVEYRGANRYESGRLQVTVHLFIDALAPRERVRAGERVTQNMTVPVNVDLALYAEDILLETTDNEAYTAREDLLPGEPIPLRKITRTLFVRGGDRVAIRVVKRNLQVETTGRAYGAGGLYDFVTVKPDGARTQFRARVTGDREVVIELQ